MDKVLSYIGERLRDVRSSRLLTLDDVAKLTGVSKPMLGQIERGLSSPTINTLWKIATGLKMPLSYFYRQTETLLTVVGLEDKIPAMEENDGMRVYTLFSFEPVRNVEVFYMEFDGGVRHCAEPHIKGVEEYVFVISGTMKIIVEGQEILLSEKQSMRFQADVPHIYHNISDQPCIVHDMIFYANEAVLK